MGIASEEGVSLAGYKTGQSSPYLPCGTELKPCRGFWMFGFSNFARKWDWDVVLVLEGKDKVSVERAADRIGRLLENPPPAEETGRLGRIWARGGR